jgi:integrase
VDQAAIDVIEQAMRAEISHISATNDIGGYRVRLTAADVAQAANLSDRSAVLTNAGMRKALEFARSKIKAALDRKRTPGGADCAADRADAVCLPIRDDLLAYTEFRRASEQLASLKLVMTGMCYVIFAVFNGWRLSEVLSVEDGYVNTVAVGAEIGSKVRKTSLEPDAVVDRPTLPIVVKAASVPSGMNGRHFSDVEKLLFRNDLGRPATYIAIESALSAALREVDIEQEITTHQFRRFFVYFYLRRFKGNLDALRRHFRHISRHMIWAYAKNSSNAKYLAKEEKRLAMEIVDGIVHGRG